MTRKARAGRVASSVVRRSVALPRSVVEAAAAAAGPELRENFNRLVVVALEEYVRRRKEREFSQAMSEMAADPGIQYESTVISEGLAHTDDDGLGKGRS